MTRFRSLYALLFLACGGSHRAAQRMLGRDVRGLIGARDFPSLDCVIALARALGLSPGTMVAFLTGTTSARNAINSDTEQRHVARDRWENTFEARVICADLNDDANAITALVEEMPTLRSALRTALIARLSTMRGLSRANMRAGDGIDVAFDNNIRRHDALADVMMLTTEAEAQLAQTWSFHDAWCLRKSVSRRATSRELEQQKLSFFASDHQDEEALALRASFHRESLEIIEAAQRSRESMRDVIPSLEILARRRDASSARSNTLAHVWTTSIVGLTALRVLRIAHTTATQRGPRDHACEARLRRIAIEAGFILDDAARSGDARVERLACARRARFVLAEQAVREADGENVLARADEHDLLEIRAAALRFPDAGGFIQHFRIQTTFSQLAHFAIDASSAHR